MKTDDISLYYDVHGRGEPLLLIAGLGSDSSSWAGICCKLAKHFRVIAFDNRGSGRSNTSNKKYSIREMADDAISLIDHLQIKKCHVLGHSMGGYIAQELAMYYPERVGKLILEATALVSSSRNNMLFNDFLKRFEKDHDNEALIRLWAYWLFSPKTFERKKFIATFIRKASTYPYLQSAEEFKVQINAIVSFSACANIKNIKAKTLIIIGSDDILIYSAESMKLAKCIKGSVFEEIKNTGHCLHIENPDVFTSKVIQFLK